MHSKVSPYYIVSFVFHNNNEFDNSVIDHKGKNYCDMTLFLFFIVYLP